MGSPCRPIEWMVKEEDNELVELRKRFDLLYTFRGGLERECEALRVAVNKAKEDIATKSLRAEDDEGKWSWLIQLAAIGLLFFLAGRSASDMSLDFFLRDY